MIFSFILCVGLQQSEGKVNADVWAFLLTGGSKLPKESLFPNPAPRWLRSVSVSLTFPLQRECFRGTTCSLIISNFPHSRQLFRAIPIKFKHV